MLLHALEELLLQLLGSLVVGIEFQGFLVVLHHVEVITLAVPGGILHDAYHIEEAANAHKVSDLCEKKQIKDMDENKIKMYLTSKTIK